MREGVWRDAFAFMNEAVEKTVRRKSAVYDYFTKLGEISSRLVEYRIEHGLNQTQMAKKLGVTQSMISKYESGDYNFSIKTLCEVCEKLNCNLSLNITADSRQEDKMSFEGAEEDFSAA